MGILLGWFLGYQYIIDDVVWVKFEKVYGVEIDGKLGFDNIEMFYVIEEGSMKVMYFVGEDMVFVDLNVNYVYDILFSFDFFVVQDIFFLRMV